MLVGLLPPFLVVRNGGEDSSTGELQPTFSVSSYARRRKYGSVFAFRTTALYEISMSVLPSASSMLIWAIFEDGITRGRARYPGGEIGVDTAPYLSERVPAGLLSHLG